MKLLHTSDWHLGARLGRVERAPDHRAALRGLLRIADEEQPDLILHTGDLFDAYRPPYGALELGIVALGRLSRIAPTVVLCGNHDSPRLLGVLDHLAGAQSPKRLWFLTRPAVWSQPGHPAVVACVPFLRPGAIANYATDDPSQFEGNYADGIRLLNHRQLDEAREAAGSRGIVLYAAHLHVHGARPGRSEKRMTVGDDYATHLDGLQRALYCAFGHIHDPQLLPGGITRGRYAGSLIPLDFGESRQTKQAVVVEVAEEVRVEPRELPGGRPLVDFDGTLDELEARAADGGLDESILRARVVSDEPVPDLMDRLAEWSPRCHVFHVANAVRKQAVKAVATHPSDGSEPPIEELFEEWRTTRGARMAAPAEAVRSLFSEALGAAAGDAPDFGTARLAAEADRVLASLAAARRHR